MEMGRKSAGELGDGTLLMGAINALRQAVGKVEEEKERLIHSANCGRRMSETRRK